MHHTTLRTRHATRRRTPVHASVLSAAICSILLAPAAYGTAGGDTHEFDPAFFAGGGVSDAIIARFSNADAVPEGTYAVTVRLNGERRHDGLITFSRLEGQHRAQPCLSDADLIAYGVRSDALHPPTGTGKEAQDAAACAPLGQRVTDATATFDLRTQVLDLRVPNVSVTRTPKGRIQPEELDPGINAGMLTYRATHFTTRNAAGASSTGYLGLQGGINLGHWRLRHAGAFAMTGSEPVYTSTSTSAERPLPRMGARITLGEHFTSGQNLDSVRIRGTSLMTDPRMLPDSASGYAPIVRGVAETNALVRITQRGMTLSETQVAPGAFAIDDLNPTGYGGALDVQIIESDGRTRTYSVPYASTPELLREGQARYEATVGQFDEASLMDHPWLAQGSFARGMTSALTAYTAGAVADGYRSLQVGVAGNTRAGAISMDVTSAWTQLGPSASTMGQQMRARFSRNFTEHGITLALGAYRYSTQGYLGMADAFRATQSLRTGASSRYTPRPRGRLDVTLNKTLGRFGTINLYGTSEDYRGQRARTSTLTAGYGTAIGHATLSINAMRSMVHTDNRAAYENTLHLGLMAPLGTPSRSPMVSLATEHRDGHGDSQRVGVNGRTSNRMPISYFTSVTRGDRRATQFNASAQHTTGIGELQASVTRGGDFRSASWGVTGGLVAHPGGLTLAPALGDTIAVVSAPGADGATVGHGNAHIARSGFAVVPFLTPYRSNTVSIDPAGTSMDVHFATTSAHVAPTAGAAVRVGFDSRVARAMMIETSLVDGRYLPFGADVLDMEGNSIGLVGQSGRVFIQREGGLEEMTVQWGKEQRAHCRISLPAPVVARSPLPYVIAHAVCEALAPALQPDAVPSTAHEGEQRAKASARQRGAARRQAARSTWPISIQTPRAAA